MIVRRVAHLAALVVVAGLIFGSSVASAAPDKADCQLFEIKATKDPKGGVDPALKPLKKKLSKPPFDSWKSFELLARHRKKVERMKPLELELEPGGKLTLLYRDRITAKGKKARLRLSLTLDNKDGKRIADLTIKLDSGDYNLIGGGRLPGGAAYILATTCKVE